MKIKKNNRLTIGLIIIFPFCFLAMEEIPLLKKMPHQQSSDLSNNTEIKDELLMLIKEKKRILLQKNHDEYENCFFATKIIISLDILKKTVKNNTLSRLLLEKEKNTIIKSIALLKENRENETNETNAQ